jgi:hypothetical protein
VSKGDIFLTPRKTQRRQFTMTNTLAIIKDPQLAIQEDAVFLKFVHEQKKALEQIQDAWDAVEKAMRDNGITKMSGEYGTLQFVPRKSWKASGKVPPRFYKTVLDTTKLTALDKLGEKLPEGVAYTTSYSFRKDIAK